MNGTLPAIPEDEARRFVNPYKGDDAIEPSDQLRICVDVRRSHVARIRSVTMDWGTMQVALSLFVKHLYDYAIEHDLTIEDRDRFIDHILSRCASDPSMYYARTSAASTDVARRTTGVPDTNRPHGDVGRTAGPVDQNNPLPPNQPTTGVRKSSRAAKSKGEKSSG